VAGIRAVQALLFIIIIISFISGNVAHRTQKKIDRQNRANIKHVIDSNMLMNGTRPIRPQYRWPVKNERKHKLLLTFNKHDALATSTA